MALRSTCLITALSLAACAADNEVVLNLEPSKANPRNSEGAFATLADGRLMFAYSRYTGEDWEDHAPADIAARYSSDGGETWSAGDRILTWMGGYYDEAVSINPFWKANFKVIPEHPVTRGVKPFAQQDEWYYNLRWCDEMKGVTPLLKAVPPDGTRGTADAKKYPGREEIVAWAFERPDGGRAFGFTGGHSHKNFAHVDLRRLLTNAILWTAKVEIPAEGAKCDLDPKDLTTNLDFKGLDPAAQLKLRDEVKALKARVAELEKENEALKAKAK
jgi:hypothetical protein